MVKAARRLASYLRTAGRIRAGRSCAPRMLTYTVTFACNARCIMCDSWRKSASSDLSVAELERVLETLPAMDVIRLTGGEPFVRRDLLEIAWAMVRRLDPAILHVTTNGFLTGRIVDFCERRPRSIPLDLLVSLDGTQDAHDAIRGHAGAYRSALRTLRTLAPRRKELRLNLAVNQTIVDAAGAAQYRELSELLATLGIRNQVVVAYKESATYSLDPSPNVAPRYPGAFETFGDLASDELERLFAEIGKDLRSYSLPQRIAKDYYIAGIRNRLLHGRGRPNPPCVALRAHLRIFPNGDVPVCQFNGRVVGNLRDEAFPQVWSGEAVRRARTWVRECPGCWAECEVLPSAVYSGDILRYAAGVR